MANGYKEVGTRIFYDFFSAFKQFILGKTEIEFHCQMMVTFIIWKSF